MSTVTRPTAAANANSLVEIVAEYRRDRWRSAEGFAITICASNEHGDKFSHDLIVKVNDPNEELQPGLCYRFFGRFIDDPKWGRQFNANTFVESTPATRRGILAYLETAPGIGTGTARELFEKYGTDAITELRDNPEKVAAEITIRGFSLEKAEAASKDLKGRSAKEAIILDLMDLLDGRGFPKAIYDKAVQKWGNRAATMIRVNPYELLRFRGVGFSTAHKLYTDLGKSTRKLRCQSVCALYSLYEDRVGHTWFPVEKISAAINEKIGGMNTVKPNLALRAGIRAGLLVEKTVCPRCEGRKVAGYASDMQYMFGDFTAGEVVKTCHECRGAGGKKWVAISDYAESEKRVAEMVADAVYSPPSANKKMQALAWPKIGTDTGCSQHQVDALAAATLARFGLLIGSPGSGKSYAAARLITACMKISGSRGVGVCAPTGKAAARMSQAMNEQGIKLKATTIHKMLSAKPAMNGEDDEFELSAEKLTYRFIFVDETSMIDVPLMRALLNAIPSDCAVLFIGDKNQLPPIGHGAPLRDFMAAGIPCGELTEIRRSSGNGNTVCAAIRDGQPFWQYVTPQPNFAAECPENIIFRTANTAEIGNKVLETVSEFQSWDFDPVWDTQVIVATNDKSQASRKVLNQKLQAMLNPSGKQHPRSVFRIGDKVIHLKNCYLKNAKDEYRREFDDAASEDDAAELKQNAKADEVAVSNGEFGRVMSFDPKDRMIVRYEFPVRYVLYPSPRKGNDAENGNSSGETKGQIVDLGYAATCHKMQGSQAKAIALVLDDSPGASGPAGICKREWLFTGISRMQKLVAMIGRKDTAERMVARQALPERKTFLAELIVQERKKIEEQMQEAAK